MVNEIRTCLRNIFSNERENYTTSKENKTKNDEIKYVGYTRIKSSGGMEIIRTGVLEMDQGLDRFHAQWEYCL